MHRILIALVLAVCSLLPIQAEARLVGDPALTQSVLSCYASFKDKTPTIQQMHDCAGVWVTPDALLLCAIGNGCPVMSDTLADRGTFYADLAAKKLTIDSTLLPASYDKGVTPESLPPLPTKEQIEQCRKAKPAGVTACIMGSMIADKYTPVVACFTRPLDFDKGKCLAEQVGAEPIKNLMKCIGSDKPTPAKLTECAASPELKAQTLTVSKCAADATTTEQARKCLVDQLPPEQAKMAGCLAEAKRGSEAARCLGDLSPDYKKATDVVSCLTFEKQPLLACSQGIMSGEEDKLVRCMQAAGSGAARFNCAADTNPNVARAKAVVDCANRSRQATALAACVAPTLGGNAAVFVSCAQNPKTALSACLTAVDPNLGKAGEVISCVSQAGSEVGAFGCAAKQLGGEAGRVAGCLDPGNRAETALCLLKGKPEFHAAKAAYDCLSKRSDAISVVTYCSQIFPIDDKARATLDCVAHAGGDKARIAGCAAAAVLPPQASRLIACATNSQGVTSFAICAVSPAINEEWRIVAECAVGSGGNPVGVAGCAAGRLTVRELTKCLTGTVGKDCFGPNNTLVKALDNSFKDLLNGPGKNNEVVKAVAAIKLLAGGDNSVINNPGQLTGGPRSLVNDPAQIFGGDDSVFNNPDQIWGGPNSVFRNPKQLLGGPNSVLNNPNQLLGGPNSAARQFIEKPLGGDCSFFHRPAGC